ncbi:phage tail tape measure protein [uncultured Secundilactobacillus sp.]|uniref:phage tail tape measure protein n=1 Tax=uncultured Secundilactobacillus sp. TaxID=2813935 RepID=UPI002584815F|nr:phage tail tape measure protein [uncultured Secundilactobacillus sp.]
MVKKIDAQMGTEVYLGTLQASNSLKSLKTVVNSVTASWKAQTNALRSSGDSMRAAETRYQGLGQSIKANQAVIDNLRKKQQGLDQTTQEGAQQYAKYQSQIDRTENRISSLTRQQIKAESTMKGYNSGIIQLERSIKSSNEVTRSYVERLKAQGREVGAQREKYVGLQTALAKTKQLYVSQNAELTQNRAKVVELSGAYEKAQRSLKSLVVAGKQNTDEYKSQAHEVNQLKNKLEAANDAERQQTIRVNNTATALAKDRREMQRLSKSVGGLSRISAHAVDGLHKIGGAAGKVADRMSGLGQKMSGITLGIGAGFAYSIKQAAKLQNTYKETTNLLVTSGEKQVEAQKAVNLMRKQGAALSVRYGKSQHDIALGYQELVKRGYSSKQALGAMKSILQASVASGDSFDDTMHSATGTLEAFGLKSNNTAKMLKNSKVVVNEMAYAADATSTDFQSLGKAMEYAGTTAHTAGYSLAETSAAVGVLSNSNLEADKAGTGLRKVINSLISISPAGAKALKSIGVSTKDFTDSHGKLKSMSTIFGELNVKMKGMSKAQKVDLMHKVFGTTGQQAALILAQNSKELGKLNDQVERSSKQKGGGYVQRLADKNMQSTQNQMKKAQRSVEAIALTLGATMLPTVNKVLKVAVQLVDKFQHLPKSTQKWVTYIGLAVAAVGPLSFALSGVFRTVSLISKTLSGVIKIAGKLGKFTTVAGTAGKGLLGGLKSGLKGAKGTGLTGLLKGGAKGAITGFKGLAKGGGATGLLKTLGKGALKATPLNAVLSATELIGMNKKNKGEKIGRAGGSFAGGATGAAIGTAILPGIGTVLGGIGGSLLGTKLGGAIGKGVQKHAKSWGKTITSTFSKIGSTAGKLFTGKLGWEKSITQTLGKIGKSIKKTVKGWGKSISDVFKGIGNFFAPVVKTVQTGFTKILKFFGGLGKKVLNALKLAIVIPIGLVVGLGVIAFNKLKKPIENIAHGISKTVGKVFKSLSKTVSNIWNGLARVTKNVWNAIRKHVVDPVVNVYKSVTKYIRNGVVKVFNSAWNGIKKATKTAFKLVQKYVVNPVKKIYAYVKKYIWGSVVKTFKRAWDGIKNATNKAFKLVQKYVVNPIKKIYEYVKRYVIGYIVKTFERAWSRIKRATNAAFKIITRYVVDPIKKIYGSVKHWLGNVYTYWKKIWNSVVHFTGNIWESIKKKVAGGLSAIAKVINTGIKAINWVINKFGGKKTTIGYLKTHYANGTGAMSGVRNAITQPTHAVLNDGHDSPETGNREMAVLPNGQAFIPQQPNWEGILPARTEVFNATETKHIMASAGVHHFAQGTGLLGWLGDKVSGVVDWAGKALGSFKDMVSTAGKILAHPVDSLNSFFTSKLDFHKVVGDVQQGFSDVFKKNIVGQAKDWWSTAWDLINGAINAGGDDAAGGPITHSPGKGWVITSGFGNRGAVAGGFSAHDGVDFSGAKTVHAMNTGVVSHAGGAPAGWGGANGIGENIVIGGGGLNYIYQELNGKYNSGAKLLVSKGDSVKAGQAIAILGPSGTHVHVGATKHPMFSIGGSSTAGWLDPTKIKQSAIKDVGDSTKDKSPKASGALQKLVKGQLGSGLFAWIQKHLAPLVGGFGDTIGGNSITQAMLDKAMEVMKVPESIRAKIGKAILMTAKSESGNRNVMQKIHDVNSGGNEARGPLQFTPPTFRAFAVKGHTNVMSPYDQVLAFLNNSDYQHATGWTTIWGTRKYDWLHSGPQGHRRFANGGIVRKHQMAEIAEGNHPEAIIPFDLTKRSRGWELIGKVAASFASQDSSLRRVNPQPVLASGNAEQTERLDKLIGLMESFMELVASKPSGISERQVYDAYNRQKSRHYQLDSIRKG